MKSVETEVRMKNLKTVRLVLVGLALMTATQDLMAQSTTQQEWPFPLSHSISHVKFELALTHDGKKIEIARGTVRGSQKFLNGRLRSYFRVAVVPLLEGKIKDSVFESEEYTANVSQLLVNALSAATGIPSSSLPAAVVQRFLDARLEDAKLAGVEQQITPEAQARAFLRALGTGFTLFENESNLVELDFGYLDPGNYKDNQIFQNHFRTSRLEARVAYTKPSQDGNKTWQATFAVASDDGIWEIANPEADPGKAFVASIMGRKNPKNHMDFQGVNSFEFSLTRYIDENQRTILLGGRRPVMDRGVDSGYFLVQHDIVKGTYEVELEFSLEDFDDPKFEDVLIQRLSGTISKRTFKDIKVSSSFYVRNNAEVVKDFYSFAVGVRKDFKFGDFILGLGAYAYRGNLGNGAKVGGGVGYGRQSREEAQAAIDEKEREHNKEEQKKRESGK